MLSVPSTAVENPTATGGPGSTGCAVAGEGAVCNGQRSRVIVNTPAAAGRAVAGNGAVGNGQRVRRIVNAAAIALPVNSIPSDGAVHNGQRSAAAMIYAAANRAVGCVTVSNRQIIDGQCVTRINYAHGITAADGHRLPCAVNCQPGVISGGRKRRTQRDRAADAEGDGVCAAARCAINICRGIVVGIFDGLAQRAPAINCFGICQ